MARPTMSDNMKLLEELEETLFTVGHYQSKYSDAISKCNAEKSQMELDNLRQMGYKEIHPSASSIECKYVTDNKMQQELMQFTSVNSNVDMNIVTNQSKSLLKELVELEEIIKSIRENDCNIEQDKIE